MNEFALRTGKYLNVIQQCEKSISWPSKEETEELTYLANPDQYTQPLEKAHAFASKTLLDLLVRDRDLIGHLRFGMDWSNKTSKISDRMSL